jgi:patatin-like phospholipase/acyl hydrolase
MFVKANLLERLRHEYEDEPLALKLKEIFGANTKFGSDRLRTLLLLVLRNATTDSPWPLSNNPYAKYNDPARSDDNSKFPLWQLVRASTAAPTYFPPEVIVLPGEQGAKDKEFVFVDGGVTMYNSF